MVKKVIVMLLHPIKAYEGVVVESHSYVTSPLKRNASFRPRTNDTGTVSKDKYSNDGL